jgi:hypothetical protein
MAAIEISEPLLPQQQARCANCGDRLAGKFCASCGQKKVDKHEFALRHFFSHLLHEITHLDSNKILRTLRALILKPGLLTKEYLDGRKGQYINPIRVYLTISAVYFLFAWGALASAGGGGVQDMQNRTFFVTLAQQKGVEPAVLALRIQDKAGKYSAVLRFASVLVSGLFLMLLYRGTGRYYVEHLIFSLHFYAFDFLAKCVVAILYLTSEYTGHTTYIVSRSGYYVLALIYLYFALARVYGQSRSRTGLKATAQFLFEVSLFIGINIIGFAIAIAIA